MAVPISLPLRPPCSLRHSIEVRLVNNRTMAPKCSSESKSHTSLSHFFLSALGLRYCAQASSSCGERGLLFVVVRGLLIAVASRCRAWALGTQASVVAARGL